MLNQVAVEALYSATYLENYLDSVENLPNDLQRHISRMRQLDVDFQAILRDIEHYSDAIQKGPEAQENQVDSGDEKPSGSGLTASTGASAGHWRKRLLQKVQSALISSLEIGDEKLQLVQTMQDVVENKSRQLETDCKALVVTEFSKDRESTDCPKDHTPNSREVSSATGGNAGNTGERTKRARRARPDDRDSPVPTTPVNVGPSQRKTSNATNSATASTGAKKKKRRSGREKERSASPQEIPIDPDEPTYCLCDQVSFGEMIGCDNDLCPIEWFHFSCVQLTTKPKGKWYCPRCRGDRPTVMKPKAQFLKELERYNKEKEEKA
ncbi:inhibitor of growth protein 1 isoform X1 [Daphnia magna]|uniref:Inhibitor of growth protein n=1 Tax=Daphnia magna TaxID=35525 RepID=A0ABR0A3P5_9CRUS|nr:inhibitor of growth protein 1 isoform X1 [Daphnia magna]KAK4019766.1 hypothetical protein OUZ56_001773 [Daphnia magna]